MDVRNEPGEAFVLKTDEGVVCKGPQREVRDLCVRDAYADQGRSPRRRRSSSVQRVACRTLRRVLRVRVSLPVL